MRIENTSPAGEHQNVSPAPSPKNRRAKDGQFYFDAKATREVFAEAAELVRYGSNRSIEKVDGDFFHDPFPEGDREVVAVKMEDGVPAKYAHEAIQRWLARQEARAEPGRIMGVDREIVQLAAAVPELIFRSITAPFNFTGEDGAMDAALAPGGDDDIRRREDADL